ncbi:protein ECT2 isoform X2 [Coccinella septempunctata]|uniref:protein ECT2 isoform X2 n=1 Tax=Coccinella septempunctata TaxID=41139 RepID=UPI001D06C2DA|nr:protein ECT2 isoform X2 [Coccinella septempunctata]
MDVITNNPVVKMDEVNNVRQNNLIPQYSTCSFDSNGDEQSKCDNASPYQRICFIGDVAFDNDLRTVAEHYNLPIITSETGRDFAQDNNCSTIFVIDKFQGTTFSNLYKAKQPILGPPALKQLVMRNEPLPNNKTRPLYNLAMSGVVVCFTGFRNKDDLAKLVPLIHHMGGSIRKEMSAKVTHLIAYTCGGQKYHYAATFKVPVLNQSWVLDAWEERYDLDFSATNDNFLYQHKLKPFQGAHIRFEGFPEDEEEHMREVLISNGGTVSESNDPNCTHVVVDESSVGEKPDANVKTWVVKAEWFWMSVQKQITQCEKDYLFDDYIEQVLSPNGRRDSHQATPSSASRRKRKRIHETIQSLVNQHSPTLHKRRSSVSDAGLLSVSGSFLDCTASPDKALLDGAEVADTPRKGKTARHQVFLELLQTESNYVSILETIMTMFKKHLEEMPEEEALLNNTELNLIFGKIPPIYDVHVKMLGELKKTAAQWTEDRCIGSIIVKYANELLKAYPPFINYFEEMKEVLIRCDQNKPRFHAFLKACQTRPECGRQSLTELMIRPVQRLGSVSLLLNDILKNTPKTNPDNAALDQAQEVLKEIMTHINEDKRKTEGQVTLFNIFNEIDNCPPDMVSSHRIFIAKSEVIQLNSPDVLSSKGNNLVLFLFSDQLEVCKKKSKAFNSLKSPTGVSTSQGKTNCKPYKHIRMMALNTIKKVIDIKETEDCQKVFSLVCRHNDEVKERLYCFAMADEDADKADFLKTLTKQMATNSCTADADKFMAYLEPQQLEIDTSDLSNGTLSKAIKFASRTKMKVGRAFSFNKTPSKLKRAVSSMMSPFGSSTNLTPANQLAQMKLASYSNINEIGNGENEPENPPQAPLSVQPTRKMKSSSLSVNAMKRL